MNPVPLGRGGGPKRRAGPLQVEREGPDRRGENDPGVPDRLSLKETAAAAPSVGR